jgi:D-ribose pyranase
VLNVLLPMWKCGQIYMAGEFRDHNTAAHQQTFYQVCRGVPISYEPHVDFKLRVPSAIGLIRTGDDTMYGNMILISA